MSRVALSSIRSLTFYKDALTESRRTDPIPQLSCIGQPCKLYQPDVVRCTNVGGRGTDVDWKCEADLPEALRFGRVEVSCEGWSKPGDPYVLKDSCALQYRLVRIPDALRSEDASFPSRISRRLQDIDPVALVFYIIWVAFLAWILWGVIKSCLQRPNHSAGGTTGPSSRPHGPPGNPPGSFGSGGYTDDTFGPPPPYSKDPSPSSGWWNPGFWTGAALGGLGAHLLNRGSRPAAYDWEQERMFRATAPPTGGYFSRMGARRRPAFDSSDLGEGPSNLGSMRRSTGLGGSSVR